MMKAKFRLMVCVNDQLDPIRNKGKDAGYLSFTKFKSPSRI